MKKIPLSLLLPFVFLVVSCAAIFGESNKPETPIESLAATEILFQETIMTATIYRAQQIEAQDNQALVGVDAGLITLTTGDRVNALLAPLRAEGREMTLAELDLLIAERDALLKAYLNTPTSTSNSAQVSEAFTDLAGILDGARLALGVGDLSAAQSARARAVSVLRALRDVLANA